jgi:hypothetical protein
MNYSISLIRNPNPNGLNLGYVHLQTNKQIKTARDLTRISIYNNILNLIHINILLNQMKNLRVILSFDLYRSNSLEYI